MRAIQEPAEKEILGPSRQYVEQSAKRYKKRVLENVSTSKDYVIRGVLSWDKLLGIAEEAGILRKKIGDPISKVWNISGQRELENVYDMVGTDKDPVFSHPEALARDITRMADQISESTGRSIKKAITRDLRAGLSVEEIAENVERLGIFNPSRSMRIARTESARAVNDAASQAYRQAKADLDIDIQKQWLSSRDDKVREAHQILDGQIVGVDENFTVDGEEAQSIADFGSSYLDVNCRCTIIPLLPED